MERAVSFDKSAKKEKGFNFRKLKDIFHTLFTPNYPITIESIKESIHNVWYGPPASVRREIEVKGRRITAEYWPEDGHFRFFKSDGKPYDLTGAGAFSTINAVFNAFGDIDMKKVSYELLKNERHWETKDKFYARELKRRGYEEVGRPKTYLDYGLEPNVYFRFWRKKREEKPRGLEKTVAVTSIIALISCTFLLSSNITGSVINGLNQTSSNWIG